MIDRKGIIHHHCSLCFGTNQEREEALSPSLVRGSSLPPPCFPLLFSQDMLQDDPLPFHRYPNHDSIPHGMVLLWRPSTDIHHFSCQYPGCERRVKGHKGAMKHGRTAHKDHQPKCHTGDRPLSEEGRVAWKKEADRRRQAVHRKKVRKQTLCRHTSFCHDHLPHS